MVKRTRKASHNSGSLPRNQTTYHAINKWHEHMFERLGWMVLAKNSGCAYKLVGYKKEVEHFIEVTKNLMHSFADPDKQHDLALLLMHAECLLDFVKKMM